MNNNIIKIVILSILIYLCVNYFVGAAHENGLVNDLIYARQESDEDDDDFVEELEKTGDKYKSKLFRLTVKRSIAFGIVFWISLNYLYQSKKESTVVIDETEIVGGAKKTPSPFDIPF